MFTASSGTILSGTDFFKKLQVNAVKTVMTTNKVWHHLRDWDEAPTLLNPHCFCAIRANANPEEKKNTS